MIISTGISFGIQGFQDFTLNLSCTGSNWAVNFHWLDKYLSDSCWATERNGNSISADVCVTCSKIENNYDYILGLF